MRVIDPHHHVGTLGQRIAADARVLYRHARQDIGRRIQAHRLAQHLIEVGQLKQMREPRRIATHDRIDLRV
jgi:hypothetical protein